MYSVFEDLMKQRGLRIADVQKATGIPYSMFTDWKAGRYHPKDDKIRKIADFFGVSTDYIRTGVHTDALHEEYASEMREVIQILSNRPDIKAFIEEAQSAAPEDVKTVTEVLRSLKRRDK